MTDNSLYPVMFMSYLDVLVPALKDSWQRTCVLHAKCYQRTAPTAVHDDVQLSSCRHMLLLCSLQLLA